MYLPDVNVWVALAFPVHAHHESARAWFDGTPADRPCHFCRFTQLGFLRIANNPTAIPYSAVTQDQAWKLFDHFLSHPRVGFVDEPAGLEARWRPLAQLPRFSTKSWNDAYLAAFAQVGRYEVVTFDRGFAQYKDLHCTVLS